MLKLIANNRTKKFADFTLVSVDKKSAGITAEYSFLLETSYGIIDAQDDVDECAFNIRVLPDIKASVTDEARVGSRRNRCRVSTV